MLLTENYPLQHLNTFKVAAYSRYFADIDTQTALIEALDFANQEKLKILIIGGGSNILFTKDFDGLVIKNSLKGVETHPSSNGRVLVKAAAGEQWHKLVMWCVENNFAGIENLSLIPGCVGAAPMQNIGAYGVELKDIFCELEAVEVPTGKLVSFDYAACKFGYRNSYFKNEGRNRYVITSVAMVLQNLHQNPDYIPKTDYGDIHLHLHQNGIKKPTIRDVSNAVIAIRQSKLPDPDQLGNAGSFFKNPFVSKQKLEELKTIYPHIPSYAVDDEHVKIAAGWLIEQCGWKGKRIGNTGAHAKQALVLVNYGNATGTEIYETAKAIQQSVKQKFGIELETEVNIV